MKITIDKNYNINHNLQQIIEDSNDTFIFEFNIEKYMNDCLTFVEENVVIMNEPCLSSFFNICILDLLTFNNVKINFVNINLNSNLKFFNLLFNDITFKKILKKINYPENMLFGEYNLIDVLIRLNHMHIDEILFPYNYIFKMNIDTYLSDKLSYFYKISNNKQIIYNYLISYLLNVINNKKDTNKFKLFLCKILIENIPLMLVQNKLLYKYFMQTDWENNHSLKMTIFNHLINYYINNDNNLNQIEELYKFILN